MEIALLAGAGPAAADVSIGRANGDGTELQPAFINEAGTGDAGDVAVDGNRIYWIAGSSIGRANLDGTNVDPDFITGLGSLRGLTAGGGYVYWGGASIGRARLDGTDVEPNFLRPSGGAPDVAVRAPYLYWTSDVGIGRAGLDGSSPDPEFIETGSTGSPTSGLRPPTELAVNDTRVFWVDLNTSGPYAGSYGLRRIASATLDGNGDVQTIAQGTDERGDFFSDLAADHSRVYAVVASGLADQAIKTFDAEEGTLGGSFVTTSESEGGAFARGLATSGGRVYWSHAVDHELHCALEYSHFHQHQSGRAVRFELWLASCDRVTARLSGRAKIGHRTYQLKRKTLTIDGSGLPGALSLKPRRKDRRPILSALKRGGTATARIWLRVKDDSGNSSTLTYGVRLRRRGA